MGIRTAALTAARWEKLPLYFYFFAVAFAQPKIQQMCPTRCRCVHVEGRLTADCSGARMTSVPGPFPSGTMSVRFDNNPLNDAKWLHDAEYFLKIDRFAIDWLELSMKNCNISAFGADLFWGLPNLNKLILSRNKLMEIPTTPNAPKTGQDTFTMFRDMAKLRVLDLSHNQLTVLSRKNFDGAVGLEDIDLSFNEIKFLHTDAFAGLPKLRTVDLTRNKLNLVTRQTFSRLPHLKQLQLAANPFDCDCRLRDFVDWQRDKYIVQPPKCVFPEKLRDKPWNHLKLDEFACAPKLTPGSSGKKIVVTSGTSSMTLSCKASGVPEPRVVWEFHNATQTVVIQATPGKYELKKSILEGCPSYEHTPNTACTWLHTLRIITPAAADVGIYHCKATNPADTQYLVFQLDSDRGMIVQQVTADGIPARGTTHLDRIINAQGDDAKHFESTSFSIEKAQDTSTSGDILLISLILGATILVVIALLLSVLCYRRTISKPRSSRMQGAGGSSVAQMAPTKPKAANGYGYHIIDNGLCATSPTSIGDNATLRSPISASGVPGVNPVEKPPRTHVENFYSEAPAGICDYHRQQMERRHLKNLDDSRTGLVHAECDDSGFSDPESYYYQRFATMPYQRNQQPQLPSGARTPGQRILRPAIDDPLLEKKLLLMRRNSDGGGNGCCVGHGHSAINGSQQRITLSPMVTHAYDKGELRETAL